MCYVPTMTMPQNEHMTLEFVGLIASVILITGRNLGNHFRAQSGYLFFFSYFLFRYLFRFLCVAFHKLL